MKNDSLRPSRFDRAATLAEIRIATLLDSDPGLVSSDPSEYYCDVVSETGEHSRMLWFDLEIFAESNSKLDPTLN
jgi:hypothetical protein